MRSLVCLPVLVLLFGSGGCVVERTVTDSSGEVIYSEAEVHSPFESDEEKREQVMEKERELGW